MLVPHQRPTTQLLLGSSASQTNSERVDVHGGIVYEVTGSTTGDLTINGNLDCWGPQQKLKFSLRSFKLLTEEYFSLTDEGGVQLTQTNFTNFWQ